MAVILHNYEPAAYAFIPAERNVALAENPSVADLLKYLKVPLWGYLLLVALGAIFFWSPLFEPIFPRLNHLDSVVEKMDNRLTRIEGAMEVLIPRLARDSLSEADSRTNKSDIAGAAEALRDAITLLSKAKALKVLAGPEFFKTAINRLDRINATPVSSDIVSQTHDARVLLADYRSAIQPVPPLPRTASRVIATITPVLKISGGHLIWFGPPGRDMFGIPPPTPPHLVYVEFDNLALEGGWQTLDNAAWRGVTFLNMHLSYKGGRLILENVKFVNCSFNVIRDPQAQKVLDYAALDQESLRLGLNFPPRMTIGLNGL